MKKSDLAEIKKTDKKSLEGQVKKVREEIVDLVLDKSMGKMTNLKAIKSKRRDLAQMMTVLKQKQLMEELESGQKEAKNG